MSDNRVRLPGYTHGRAYGAHAGFVQSIREVGGDRPIKRGKPVPARSHQETR